MLIAIAGAFGSAAAVVMSGWGWFAAVAAYALGGSILLCVAASLATLPGRSARRRQSQQRRSASAYST
jgi:hypothetical protein